MDEFEDDDINLNSPLDVRCVILGLSMLVAGLIAVAFAENLRVREAGALVFFASFFVMTKKQKPL